MTTSSRSASLPSCAWLGLLTPLLAACAGDPVRTETDAGCIAQSDGCVDFAPVPKLRFQLAEPPGNDDYPYGPEAPAPTTAAPGSTVYLSAVGSADPEGSAVATFWNVQDPQQRYLTIEPAPNALRASFTPVRSGRYSITLQVTELSGLRQTGQTELKLEAAPHPCAANGVDSPCADGLTVPSGTFMMGSAPGTGHDSEYPRHLATVAAFALDKYEVTVGRFRRFIAGYEPTIVAEGSGAHPLLAGSGWRPEWITNLPATADEFKFAISECGGPWTDEIGANEARPISCVTWFEAFAFCASEGKRLPTEAEWEYAAAGGDEQREYPWGADPPADDLVVFACLYDAEASCTDADLPVAGSLPKGAGRFGQLDLAGSLWEWTLDTFAPYGSDPCDNCAATSTGNASRVFRGGDFKFADPDSLRTATRYAFLPAFPDQTRGVRCARSLDPL